MCQSPLSEANGFSRADLKNICFIAVGATASYILDNPKDFINVDKDTLNALRMACSVCEEAGLRYALVVPTRGKPFVGVIPTFNIPITASQKPYSDAPKADPSEVRDWYEEIALWYESLSIAPTMQELQAKWYQLTGMEIDEDGVRLLLEAMSTKRGTET